MLQFRSVSLVTRDTVILWSCSFRSPSCARLPACPALLQLGILLGTASPSPKEWTMKHHGICSPKWVHSWKRTGPRGTHNTVSVKPHGKMHKEK